MYVAFITPYEIVQVALLEALFAWQNDHVLQPKETPFFDRHGN